MRKYKGKLIRKPAKENISRFLNEIKTLVKSNPMAKTESLLRQLNPKIRGWAQYFWHVCAKETFGQIDSYIFRTLWRWIKRRHPTRAAYGQHGVGIVQAIFLQHGMSSYDPWSMALKNLVRLLIQVKSMSVRETTLILQCNHLKIQSGSQLA